MFCIFMSDWMCHSLNGSRRERSVGWLAAREICSLRNAAYAFKRQALYASSICRFHVFYLLMNPRCDSSPKGIVPNGNNGSYTYSWLRLLRMTSSYHLPRQWKRQLWRLRILRRPSPLLHNDLSPTSRPVRLTDPGSYHFSQETASISEKQVSFFAISLTLILSPMLKDTILPLDVVAPSLLAFWTSDLYTINLTKFSKFSATTKSTWFSSQKRGTTPHQTVSVTFDNWDFVSLIAQDTALILPLLSWPRTTEVSLPSPLWASGFKFSTLDLP